MSQHAEFSAARIESLHRKYAPSDEVFELIYTHCQIVRDIALQLIARGRLVVDQELVQAGALLHDIGVYPLFGADGKLLEGRSYITHGIEGEKILRQEHVPEALCRIASHHTGVGLSRNDIAQQNLPLPVQDYLAESDEEQLIMYADKFHSKTTPPCFNGYAWYRRGLVRFGQDKVTKFEEMAGQFGIPDLQPLSDQYGFTIRTVAD